MNLNTDMLGIPIDPYDAAKGELSLPSSLPSKTVGLVGKALDPGI
jgi:hypothetical protein